MKTVFMNKSKTAYYTIDEIPLGLKKYATENFEQIFNASKLDAKRKIINCYYDSRGEKCIREIDAHRYYQSYGATPNYSSDQYKNYMFGDLESVNRSPMPVIFKPLDDFMKGTGSYNQTVINWYESEHYIAQHIDYKADLVPNSNIAMVTLNRNDTEKCRKMKIEVAHKYKDDEEYDNSVHEIVLTHGLIIKFYGELITHFLHGIPADNEKCVERIGMTFRNYTVNE